MAPDLYDDVALSERTTQPPASSSTTTVYATAEPLVPWTLPSATMVAALFLISALMEIGGGYLVWQAVRQGKPWRYALLGSAALVVYGFLPTLQPLPNFGRLYAIYGAIFIVLSYAWGVHFDGMHIDRGDVIGSALALAGVCVALFYPRNVS